MRTLVTCLLCAVLAVAVHVQAAAPQPGTPVHSVQLTAAPDIADAAAVNDAITALVKDVASCSAAVDARACACSFGDDLKRLESAYDAAITKHPDWNAEGNVVAYVDPANGRSVAISFHGIKRQLDACAKR